MNIEINSSFVIYAIIGALLVMIGYKSYMYYKKYKASDTSVASESSKSSNDMLYDELKLESSKSYDDYKC